MDDLTLVGVHEDGEHLLLVDSEGRRHRLRVDEALRAAVRRDRARLGQLQIEMDGGLRPREIQARIRSGETAEEVAASAGVPIEHIRRYEGPVLAEREFVATQARGVRLRRSLGRDAERDRERPQPQTLGDVVADRLANREVDLEDVAWDAWRAEDNTWSVVLTFTAGSKRREARWSYDPSVRHVAPQDDEARWLTDDEPAPTPNVPTAGHRRLAPVRDRVYDVESSGAARPVPEEPPAVDLLDRLSERRGRRGRVSVGDEGGATGIDPVKEAIDSLMSRGELHRVERETEPAAEEPPAKPGRKPAVRRHPERGRRPAAEPTEDPDDAVPPAAHPARSRPQEARDGEVLVLPEPDVDEDGSPERPAGEAVGAAPPAPPAPGAKPGASTRPSARKQRRASVPSWDDIVFGQRRD